ncbi:transcription factor bHLH143 [Sesamum indicum]|uniref:Transcription factor bHLH143 n=1 Tax=Sesamum indicum TaxID=4182 RepID=A0A8M8UZH8_SESIN|nr:transcription factor bHLH143 [Sesamum indicum]XP_020551792.1 transcription factor bHLH143 [Sesamum indicum]
MVTAKESQTCQQFSAWKSPDVDHMAFLQLEQNYNMPHFPPSMHTVNAEFPGQPNADLRDLNIRQPIVVGRIFNFQPPYNTLYPTRSPCLKDSPCPLPNWLGVSNKPIDASVAPQKKFLIFDQCGDQTRLFISPSFSRQHQIVASKTPASGNGVCEKVASQVDPRFMLKPVVEEKWDENNLNDGESDMLEDSEEINALLYSDSDDEYDGDNDADDENDEVTSTRHPPFCTEKDFDKDTLLEEFTEEVASSDGSPKRQRLLDGRYKKSSLASFESPVKGARSYSYEDDVESSCAGPRSSHDDINREKKIKTREALKILESIIPGLNSSDPLSIIEKSIVYLETMKMEAETLGLSFPNRKNQQSYVNGLFESEAESLDQQVARKTIKCEFE